MFFQTTFEKRLVAETSKELVFLLPQRKIRCATTSFFGVGGSGRRPLESADAGCRRVGAFTGAGIGCTVERKLYGGRGLRLVRCPKMSILVFQMGGFTVGK